MGSRKINGLRASTFLFSVICDRASRRAPGLPVALLVALRGGNLCTVAVPWSASTFCMGKNRLEAFSDGVIAILITIMVLEMKVPHGEGLETLVPVIPVFLSYVLSFVYLGI